MMNLYQCFLDFTGHGELNLILIFEATNATIRDVAREGP